ncbi:TPA: hypothetical protein ACX6QF_003983, partial [Photobacterium damselae]
MTKEINHAHRQVIHHIHKERRNKNSRSDIVGMWVTCSHFVRSWRVKEMPFQQIPSYIMSLNWSRLGALFCYRFIKIKMIIEC